jgi:mono/diheme cytochrome c family protein
MRVLRLGALLVTTALGCGAAPHTRAAGAVSPLAVRAVEWNPARAAVGDVRAVADGGDVVTVFSDRGATVFASRVKVATDTTVSDWRGGGVVGGPAGATPWIFGVAGDGRVYRLRGLRAFEDVSDRYGLQGEHVHGAIALGGPDVAFLLGGAIAVTGGAEVTRYATPGGMLRDLGGGAGFAAEVGADEVRVLDVARRAVARYPVPGATHAALGADGRLYVTTSRAVYAGPARGALALVYDARGDTVHGLVTSGSAVWFVDGEELGLVLGDRVAETAGAKLGRDAALSPSASGDVWVIGGGALARYARADASSPEVTASAWAREIAPAFGRACASCHLPDGASGTDLSTAAAWEEKRAEIRARVVDVRSMPPAGHPLSDEDRAVIRRWVDAEPEAPASTHAPAHVTPP